VSSETAAGVASVRRILVVRLGAMGDVLHALPAVAALNRLFPHAQIGWAVEERWADLLSTAAARTGPRSLEKPLVDFLHFVNTKAWRAALFSDETWKEALGAIRELRQASYDVAIDFQGAIKSAVLARLAQAPMCIGSRQPWEHAASLFYGREVIPEGRHVVEQNISLLKALAPGRRFDPWECADAVELPFCGAHENWAQEELRRNGLAGGSFAVLSPGAGWGAKCWPAERYGEVARGLEQLGMRSLVNHGPGEEPLAQRVVAEAGGAGCAAQYTIGELIAILRRARLFVGGDTGPTHLAAALRVPLVAVFGPTDPARNGPFSRRAVVLRSAESRTSHARRAQPEPGMLAITSGEVLAAARALLQGRPQREPQRA
jgi:heptosyltransferase-1